MSSVKGRSLELFFIDGRPDGMLIAEVFNWTGHVLVAPRTRIAEALKRKEAKYTGVYILLGQSEDSRPLGYIGESEDVSTRIKKHHLELDWWETAVVVTSSANQLNKAHVRYLEARLIQQAQAVGRLHLYNGTAPEPTGLSEAATANMEAFLEHVFLVLPAVRIDYFLQQTRPSPERTLQETQSTSPLFELVVAKHHVRGLARLVKGEFVVQQGSQARKEWIASGGTYKNLYQELVATGILADAGTHRVFTENYAFRSPSAAGAVVTGRAGNGRVEWKVVGSPITYGEWEAQQLADSDSQGPEG